MAQNEDEEDDWQVICEHSLFSNRLHQLEEICEEDFKGDSGCFINEYLKPVVELLDTIRTKCEEYYDYKVKRDDRLPWSKKFENIVKFAIHPKILKTSLHKGDFYIHISSNIPRTLELKYYHIGKIYSRPLSTTDNILMCSENWSELLKSEKRDRFVYSSCIIWTSKGFEKTSWKNVLKAIFAGDMDDSDNNAASDYISLQKQSSSSSIANRDSINLEEFSIKPLLILDLNFELLQSQVVFAPGSRDKRGGSVIYFDTNKQSWDNADTNSEELTKLLIYCYKISKESVQKLGCSLVIDAREGRHAREILECIGEAISMLQLQIPGSVHMAYVLTKKDSLMLLFATSKIKERLNFEFQFISSVEKLTREISIEQLPLKYGGQLKYEHENWIKFRTKVEPFMTGCRSAAKHAMNCMQELSRTDLGYNSSDCQKLLDFHVEKVKEVFEDSRLTGLRVEGKQIIERIKEDENIHFHSEDYNDTIVCLNRLYSQMNRVFDKLQGIADKRTKTLNLCLKVRQFEESSSQQISWLQTEGFPFLEKHKDLSDSLGHAQSLMDEFEKFSQTADIQLTSTEENILSGQHLVQLDELQIDREVLQEKISELENEHNSFAGRYNERQKKLSQCVEFHTLVQEVTQWWMSGLTYIAHMNMEEIQTRDGIARLKASLLDYKDKNPPFSESQIARITELAHHLGSKQVEQAELINSRSSEVQNMLQVKQNQIVGAQERFQKPHLYSALSDGDENSSGFKDDDLSTEPDEDEYMGKTQMAYDESIMAPITDASTIFSWKESRQLYDENDAELAVYDVAMPTKMKERLRHIIEEMIDTEHDYVTSLEYILTHYLPEMDEQNLPPTLKGQKNILFGNIERIYDFHKRFFAQEVETYRHAPLQIGKCFLKWERQFYLYALYNKNKPRSDQLWSDFGNNFFQSKMKELKDKLDLASYLIKPVQRLGKYSLLLKDMIRCCDPIDPRITEIKTAHELMKFQLRHGNDLLAMDAIRNTDVNLKEQGCLLRQADFIVSYGKRKRVRRVFLFEHVLLFTKAKKQKAKGDEFAYKHSIKMADLGLTQNIGDSGLKFEVWYRRWKKDKAGHTYVLQAASESVKTSWTADISRILWRQAARNKEYGEAEITTGISVESTPSAIFMDSEHSTSYSRARLIDVSSPRSTEFPVNNKRLSWLSTGESSNSSGVFDLGSLPEDSQHLAYSPRDDMNFRLIKRGEHDVKYSSLPRKKHSLQMGVNTRTEMYDASHPRDPAYDVAFIRNNVYRKTLQVDSMKGERQKAAAKKVRRRGSSTSSGRYATQPIILPSSLTFTEGISCTNSLPRSYKSKKISLDRSACSHTCIQEIIEEDILTRTSREVKDNIPKSSTDTQINYGPVRGTKMPLMRRSSTDGNINGQRLELRQTMSFNVIEENVVSELPVRKSSYTKALKDCNNLSVDEKGMQKEKRLLLRQRSSSSGDASELYGLKNSPSIESPKPTTQKRNPFQNLKAKISKSLSEM